MTLKDKYSSVLELGKNLDVQGGEPPRTSWTNSEQPGLKIPNK